MIVLYILFFISIICPVYTYAIYPFALKLLKKKQFKKEEITPSVTVIIRKNESNEIGVREKTNNILACGYDKEKLAICVAKNTAELNQEIEKASANLILFTDIETEFDSKAIKKIVCSFADERIGYVVGQQTNKIGNSTFWKYENKVKVLESEVGIVSGTTGSIYAVRKELIPEIPEDIINQDFYIVTKVTQNGKNSVFDPEAIAYEKTLKGTNFDKHVKDAAGNYQALKVFMRMLLPCNGWFEFVGHRVMKWLVPFNMIVLFATNGLLMIENHWFGILFLLQIFGYGMTVLYHVAYRNDKEDTSIFIKLLSIADYFVSLNAAMLVGLFKGTKYVK